MLPCEPRELNLSRISETGTKSRPVEHQELEVEEALLGLHIQRRRFQRLLHRGATRPVKAWTGELGLQYNSTGPSR